MSRKDAASMPMVPKVFICYRREETAAHAGRLYDAMVARFGERNVFMDVDIAPGADFVERITEVVSACQVLIVVMGPSWATARDEEGGPRIADPNDFVRLEIETGLRRPEVTLIPVLVAGARMPKPEDLPDEVRAITRRNALELSEARWRYDVGRLNETLDRLLADVFTREHGRPDVPAAPAQPASARSAAGAEAGAARSSPGRRAILRWAIGGVAALAAIAAGLLLLAGGGGACSLSEIGCVVERASKPAGPEDCEGLQTLDYLEQTTFRKGEEALRRCETNAANTANDPDSVGVSVISSGGRTATAEVSFDGGFYDGQTQVVGLTMGRGGQWRLNRIRRFVSFDKAHYLDAFEETVPHGDPPLTPPEAKCVAGYLARFVPTSELEAAILAGDAAPFGRAYRECGLG